MNNDLPVLTDVDLNAIERGIDAGDLTHGQVQRLIAEVRRLQATLDGDPYQIATPEQRRAWRLSAIRYADKVEAELATALAHLDAIIVAYQSTNALGPLINACRAAKEWRGVKSAGLTNAQDASGAMQSP